MSPTTNWPRILPAINSMVDTAESSTSAIREDFSSIVVVIRYWLEVITEMKIRNMKANGIRVATPSYWALRSPCWVTRVD